MHDEPIRYEAARFALLSRISGSLRHRLLGELQPIGFTAALAGKQMQNNNPDAAAENAGKIQNLLKRATESAIYVMAWLVDETPQAADLKKEVGSCIELIRTDCEIRGFRIESGNIPDFIRVRRQTLRTLFVSTVLAIIDTSDEPLRLHLTSEPANDGIKLHFHLIPLKAASGMVTNNSEHRLNWDDVEALALHDNAVIVKSGEAPCRYCQLQFQTDI